MAAVTQKISNFLGGVSNQPDDKKFPGQVTDALNAYPDPTFGLQKRPGLKFISELTSSSTALSTTVLDNAKWFYYNRDADERYIGCIVGASSSPYGQIYIWNAHTYAECTVNYTGAAREYLNAVNASDYDTLTIRDTTIVTNKTKTITTVAGSAFTAGKVGTVRIKLAEYSSKYTVTINGTDFTHNTRAADTAANDAATTNTSGDPFLSGATILADLKTLIDAGSTGVTVQIIGPTLEISKGSAFTLKAEGGKNGTALTAYQDDVDTITELSAISLHGRVVKINNTTSDYDDYYAKFKANDGTKGSGIWEETLKPGESTGLTATTMPHKLFNTNKNVFTFEAITWVDRKVGDDVTNSDPSFVGTTIQQSFYYNNRLGFLSDDNVVLSRSDDFYNFYMASARTSVDNDPVDISCSSTRPANLHAVIPTAGGLFLFSQDQQFIMFSADGNFKPTTALIRSLSNYRMDKDIDPVDTGTVINFVSKTHDTAGFTRIFSMVPQGVGSPPIVVDSGRVVSEYIPVAIDNLITSPQNSFIAMSGKTLDKVYFYRTYNDGNEDLMQSWFNWQLPGNAHYITVDSDTMYSVVKTGTGSDARYNLCSATMTMTPEETIITTAEGIQVNPHMDFYTAASSVKSREVKTLTIAAGGSGYSSAPTLTIAAPPDGGVQATATCTVNSGAINAVTITNAGSGYPIAPTVTVSGGGGSSGSITATVDAYDGSRCYIPFKDVTTLTPVIIISGAVTNFSGTTQSGFTINPDRATDAGGTYFKVPDKDLTAQAANVYVGYKYNYDITLPKIYFQSKQGTDFTANLTISRCKFSIGQSSVVGFKLKRKGVQAATQSFTGDGSNKVFSPDFDVIDKADVIVKKNGAKQLLTTDYTIADHANQPDNITVTFGSAPASGDTIEIYIDNWYTIQPTQDANYYLGDDVPLDKQNTFIVPIHQRTDNYTLRVFSDSPFPVALTSMAWEGNYSPRYYRRT